MAQSFVLEPAIEHFPITALRCSARQKLCSLLNGESTKVSRGYTADFRGVSELIGFNHTQIEKFKEHDNHTLAMLEEWETKSKSTIGLLWKTLTILERFDILKEMRDTIYTECISYMGTLQREYNERQMEIQTEEGEENSKTDENSKASTACWRPRNGDLDVDESKYMTRQDVLYGPGQTYDALVCYNTESGDDLQFVLKMIDKLEGVEHNLKLLVPDRDELPGGSMYTIAAKLIKDRCKRMIIILSPDYLDSVMCDFQTRYAHSLAPGARSKRLIIILRHGVEFPELLRNVTTLDFTREDIEDWQWKRLPCAVAAPIERNEHGIWRNKNKKGLTHLITDQARLMTTRTIGSAQNREAVSPVDSPQNMPELCSPKDRVGTDNKRHNKREKILRYLRFFR